jgi:hypothetical protein
VKFIAISIFIFFSFKTHAQHRKATTFQDQVRSQRASNTATKTIPKINYRILANFEYANSAPNNLNTFRSEILWGGTTATEGQFSDLTGFSVGTGFMLYEGFLGLELEYASQNLPNTEIGVSGTSIQDGFEYETVQLTYDWVFQESLEHSFELGFGIGMATKFKFTQKILTSSTETVIWKDSPFTFKLRGFYSYHFSEHVRIRLGLGYEGLSSNSLKSEGDHPGVTLNGQPISSGLTLQNSSFENVTADLTGARASAGLVVAF